MAQEELEYDLAWCGGVKTMVKLLCLDTISQQFKLPHDNIPFVNHGRSIRVDRVELSSIGS